MRKAFIQNKAISRRAIGVQLGYFTQVRPHGVHLNVFPEFGILLPVSDASIMKARTPNFTAEIEFFFSAIRKAAFDELDGLLDGFVRSQQEMEVIGHQNEFVQAIFPLVAIAKKDIEEEVGHSVRLEHMSALGTRRRHEVSFHNRYLGG